MPAVAKALPERYKEQAMNYGNPDPLPRQGPGTNPPHYPVRADGWGSGVIALAIIVAVIIAGVIVKVIRGTSASGPHATQSAPSSTGQGGGAAPPATKR